MGTGVMFSRKCVCVCEEVCVCLMSLESACVYEYVICANNSGKYHIAYMSMHVAFTSVCATVCVCFMVDIQCMH